MVPFSEAGSNRGFGAFGPFIVAPGESISPMPYFSLPELTYWLYFQKSALFFQPDLQYIIRPGGTGKINDAFILGCQLGINF